MKKIICLLIAVILCMSLFVFTTSAKISAPVNTIKTNGNGGKTDVGAWFMTYNSNSMWANNFGSGYPIRYRTLMPDGSYGILDSSNIEHIDFQLEKIAEAKIDFILFDITNGGLTEKVKYGWSGEGKNSIINNARLTCQRIAEWNKNNDWKIKYCIGVGAYEALRAGALVGDVVEWQAEAIYKEWYLDPEIGGDNYYQVDGKLFLEIHDWGADVRKDWEGYAGDTTYGDKFFVRNGMNGEPGTYGWYCAYGTSLRDEENEVMLVSPGQRNAGSETPHAARDNGKLYKTCWESVLTGVLPRIVMISSFNDFNEQTAVWTADSSRCRGDFDEQWTDETGKINNSMYWDMTVEGIRLVRTFNGEIEGEMTSTLFDLNKKSTDGDSASSASSSSNLIIIIVIIVTTVVVLAAVAVVLVLVLKGKKKK